MIREGKFRPSSSTVGSSILCVPKPNDCRLRLCIDNHHLNDYTQHDGTPLMIMEEVQSRLNRAMHITEVELQSGFYLIRLALGHEKFTAFRTKFDLYEYMVMHFALCNAPATFQREMKRILEPLIGFELVINIDFTINQDNGMVIVTYIDDMMIASKESLEKHPDQITQDLQLLIDNHICIEIDKYIFDDTETTFVGVVVSASAQCMDPENEKAIVDWPWPISRKEV